MPLWSPRFRRRPWSALGKKPPSALPSRRQKLPTTAIWLRSQRFDLWLQIGALVGIAPALMIHATLDAGRASSLMSLASLIAIPFLHVFGSFFFAFSTVRNRSVAHPPGRLALQWALWGAAALGLQLVAPRALATFALLYGGWHILRQNFGFLRELAGRAGVGEDRALRWLDQAACMAPAVALWLLIAARGPWRFIGAEVYHPALPAWLLAAAFAAVPATALARQQRLDALARRRSGASSSRAGWLLLAGNAVALLGPALLLDDLLLIYTLAASFHGIQYLAYLVERERERSPGEDPIVVLLPLARVIALSMLAFFVVLTAASWLLSPARAELGLLVAWYAIVPFHYFVDGRIWRRPRQQATGDRQPATGNHRCE